MESDAYKSSVSSDKKENIVASWEKVASSNQMSKLTEHEKAQFEKARFAEEQNKRSSFVLGGCIRQDSGIL